MSEAYPYRTFEISGHLPEEDWKAAVQLLGQAGLYCAEQFPLPFKPAAEALVGFDFPADDTFVSKAHFMRYAAEAETPNQTARRSWNAMASLFDAFVYRDYYAVHPGPERPPNNPIRFRTMVPPECSVAGHTVWRRNLQELSMSSLGTLLHDIEVATRIADNERAAIAQVLGPRTGPSVVQFLRGFAETWQPADA